MHSAKSNLQDLCKIIKITWAEAIDATRSSNFLAKLLVDIDAKVTKLLSQVMMMICMYNHTALTKLLPYQDVKI